MTARELPGARSHDFRYFFMIQNNLPCGMAHRVVSISHRQDAQPRPLQLRRVSGHDNCYDVPVQQQDQRLP